MNLLICLGGSGQLVLHYYLQWYLLGVTRNKAPLRALVIDQDDLSGSLAFAERFFNALTPTDRLIDETPAPWVRYQRLELPDEKSSVRSMLTGNSENPMHPALAYLDAMSMNQTIKKGFYARPCLIPIFWEVFGARLEQQIDRAYNDCAKDGEVRVIVTGSVLGGAGGGLLLPVLDYLTTRGGNPKLSVVLFDEYFRFDGMEDTDRRRFRSNAVGVLRMMLERFRGDGSFAIHRCTVLKGSVERRNQSEREGKHLEWPAADGSDPRAEACQAIEKLFGDTQLERPTEPTDYLVEPNDVPKSWRRLADARARALDGVEFLAFNNGLSHLSSDLLAKWIWGNRIPDFLARAWEAWIRAGNEARYTEFPEGISQAFRAYYDDPEYGVLHLFPSTSRRPNLASLKHLAANVPVIPEGLPMIHDHVSWAAANLMFFLLRRGGV